LRDKTAAARNVVGSEDDDGCMVVGCAGKSIIHKVQSIDQLNHALSLHL
jgi:hypothetical protein